jgi:hypothetical protein
MVIALKEFFLHELLYLPEYMLKPTKQAFLWIGGCWDCVHVKLFVKSYYFITFIYVKDQ